MKKTISYILAILLLSVAAVTLFAIFDNSKSIYQSNVKGSAAITFTHDKTVLPDFIYNNSIIFDSSVYTINAADSEYAAEEDADCVMLGTVIETFYTFVDGTAWTQANVRVDEVTRGKLSEGEIISVYFPGGYASMDDYVAAHGTGQYSSTGAQYLEFIMNGEPHPQPGDNAMFCLDKLPNGSPLPDGAYMRLNVIMEDELTSDGDADETIIS